MLAEKLQGAVGNASNPVYVEDVFSTYLYTGNGTLGRTITNGIDLSTKGGMVWVKNRSAVDGNGLFDTNRGVINGLQSDSTGAENTVAGLSSVTTTGYVTNTTSASYYGQNKNGANIVSWTFAKQAKFFDVVTYTGNGAGGQTISHNLGSRPGFIIIKATSDTSNWFAWHRLNSNDSSTNSVSNFQLNSTNSATQQISYGIGASTINVAYVLDSSSLIPNNNGVTYVAYLFAHNAGGFGASGTDNVISCGNFDSDSNGAAGVDLGYEPQWILYKPSSGTGDWRILDNMRAWSYSSNSALFPNSSIAEITNSSPSTCGHPTSTGFYFEGGLVALKTYIYVAIRRPMKPPTTGTSVFTPVAYDGTGTNNRLVNTSIVTDMTMARARGASSSLGFVTGDRLRGDYYLGTYVTNSETSSSTALATPTSGYGNSFSAQNGFGVGSNATTKLNTNGEIELAYAFKRASGFFDEVCYTGTGVGGETFNHNLTVAPELMIIKARASGGSYPWWSALFNTTSTQFTVAYWNTNDAGNVENYSTSGSGYSSKPTATTFSLSNVAGINNSGGTYVAYLFATLAGISKVGTYTGNGSSQTINCGFTGGARFVLIKRTDATGNWWVFDTARGMTLSTTPYLWLNSSNTEASASGGVQTVTTGFSVDSNYLIETNYSGATYLFLAIA